MIECFPFSYDEDSHEVSLSQGTLPTARVRQGKKQKTNKTFIHAVMYFINWSNFGRLSIWLVILLQSTVKIAFIFQNNV